MKKIINENHGFTLIELMIAVGIIAILAAIAIPSFLGIQKKSARSEAKANLEAIALALEGYMAENNDYGAPGAYSYVCGDGCSKSSFGFPGAPLGTIANLGGGYDYNYWITVSTAPPGPSFIVSASALRGYVAGDQGHPQGQPSINSSGEKLPAAGFW